jgi:putative SOS response-associated peptidase YedK
MCYHTTQKSKASDLKKAFNLPMINEEEHTLFYHANGYDHPKLAVIANDGQHALHHFRWGLIPHFMKSLEEAIKISQQTLNAKAETVFDKPSFRNSIMQHRCIIPVNGFFEWKHLGKDKQPFFIHPKAHDFFLLAGIYSHWMDKQHNELVSTFSILTTEANELMADIHNTKKRMPLILDQRNMGDWIDGGLPKSSVIELMQGCDDSIMAAYPVSKLLSAKNRNSDIPEILNRVDPYTLFS